HARRRHRRGAKIHRSVREPGIGAVELRRAEKLAGTRPIDFRAMPHAPQIAPHLAAIPASVYSALAERLERHAGERYPLHVGDTWMEPAPGCRMENLTVAEHPGMHRYASVHGLPTLLDA